MHTAIGTASALQAGIAARGYDAISMALFGRAAAQDKRGVVMMIHSTVIHPLLLEFEPS